MKTLFSKSEISIDRYDKRVGIRKYIENFLLKHSFVEKD